VLGATIPEDTNVELAVDLLYGPLFHRLLHAHAPLSADSSKTSSTRRSLLSTNSATDPERREGCGATPARQGVPRVL
jgi:hypothetical protein